MKKEIKKEEKVKKEPKVKKEKIKELENHAKIANATSFGLIELNNKLSDEYLKLKKEFNEFKIDRHERNLVVYNEIQSLKEKNENYKNDTKLINSLLHEVVDDLRKDINEKHSYQNERLTKQAETHRLKIEQVKHEFQKVHEKNNELESHIHGAHKRIGALNNDCEKLAKRIESSDVIIGNIIADKIKLKKEVAKTEFILLGFIGLNFGLTIFLLINFFTVFDF